MKQNVADRGPADLGLVHSPDPFAVQPGSILQDRFCVLGRVRHDTAGWRLAITDLERRLGTPPHHRLTLIFLPVDGEQARRIHRALPLFQEGSRRIQATMSTPEGLLLATLPAETPTLDIPLSPEGLKGLGSLLSRIVAGLHQLRIVGVRFEPRQLTLDLQGRLQFAHWSFLLDLASQGHDSEPSADVAALVRLLERLGPLPADHPFESADDLARHLEGDPARAVPSCEMLPAIPPFVGRRGALLTVHHQVSAARHQGPRMVEVHGDRGSGKSRLLDQIDLELQRGETALCVRLGNLEEDPRNHGLATLVGNLATAMEALPESIRDPIGNRMRQRVGLLAGVVDFLDARLGSLLGHPAPPPRLPLDQRFVRDASTTAAILASVGTPDCPLVLLIDDFHRSDASIRAMLYHLLVPETAQHTLVVLTSPTSSTNLPAPADTIHLSPWSTEELEALVSSSLPDAVEGLTEVVADLQEASGGMPQEAWGTLLGWVHQGRLRYKEGWWVANPPQEAKVLQLSPRWRWDELSADPRRIATIMAVRPEPIGITWLQRVLQWPFQRIDEAIGKLLSIRLLIQTPAGLLAWPSEGVRGHVLESASGDALRRAHGAVARWFEGLEDDVAAPQHAWHAEQAGVPGPDEVLADLHMEAGAEVFRTYDAERAQWHFERALARTGRLGIRQRALEGRADALLIQDRFEGALVAYLSAIDTLTEPVEILAIANRALHTMYLHGEIDATIALADRSLKAAGQRVPRGFAEALLQTAGALWRSRRPAADPDIADALCLIHTTLVACLASSHPHVAISSLARGMSAAAGRGGGPAARARAFGSVFLAAMGWTGAMSRMLQRAETDALAAKDTYAVGVVNHIRGQSVLGLGDYDQGQAAIATAVDCFQRSGDLTVGVMSMVIGAFYALDREPVDRLTERFEAAEAAALRQRNQGVLTVILGSRLLAWARAEQIDQAAARQLAEEVNEAAVNAEMLMSITGDAATALGLLEVGCALEAKPFADRALINFEQTPVKPLIIHVALVAAARVAVARISGTASLRYAQKRAKELRRHRKSIPALWVASHLVDAMLFAATTEFDNARRAIEVVIAGAEQHGELWQEMKAHQMAARYLGTQDPLAAQAHLELAERLRQTLCPEAQRPAVPDTPPQHAAHPHAETRLDLAIEELESLITPHLSGRALSIHAWAGLRTTVAPELVELLLVSLVLAASDASTGDGELQLTAEAIELSTEEAARFPDAMTGSWARVRARVSGTRGQGAQGALAECSDLCRQIGGFLDVRPGDQVDFSAWLPASRSTTSESQGLIGVLLRDVRIQRTLVDGIRQLGWSAQILSPNEGISPDVVGILVEPELSHLVPHGLWSLEVVERSRSWDRDTQLAIPFLLREFHIRLADFIDREEDSSGRSPQ